MFAISNCSYNANGSFVCGTQAAAAPRSKESFFAGPVQSSAGDLIFSNNGVELKRVQLSSKGLTQGAFHDNAPKKWGRIKVCGGSTGKLIFGTKGQELKTVTVNSGGISRPAFDKESPNPWGSVYVNCPVSSGSLNSTPSGVVSTSSAIVSTASGVTRLTSNNSSTNRVTDASGSALLVPPGMHSGDNMFVTRQNLAGNDLVKKGIKPVASFEACKAHCAKDSRCDHFTFDTRDRACWIKQRPSSDARRYASGIFLSKQL